jgi:hypothetical protein
VSDRAPTQAKPNHAFVALCLLILDHLRQEREEPARLAKDFREAWLGGEWGEPDAANTDADPDRPSHEADHGPVLDPAGLADIEPPLGIPRVNLDIRPGRLKADVSAKSVRKVLSALTEAGPDDAVVLVQGVLGEGNLIEGAAW